MQRLVVGQSLRLAVLGTVLGLGLAVPLTRVLRSMLFGVSPTDPITLITVSLGLITAAGLAAFGPARGATRVDPVETLNANVG